MSRPVIQTENAGTPPGAPPRASGDAELWTVVHEQVQVQFAELEREVRRRLPDVQVSKGRTNGGSFTLFTYRAFRLLSTDIDSVVCGLTFSPTANGVTIVADVSGESIGDVIFEAPAKTVEFSRDSLLSEATRLSQELGRSADAIVRALQDSNRRPS